MENLSRIKWLKGEVEANRKMTEQLLVELVKIDTITDNLTGYNQALYIIQNFLEESGFATLLIGPGDKKNLLAYMGDYKNPKLLLNGHLDVVGVGDVKTWERYPFSATIESGRLYGRGSCDMKGGIAAMLMAARVISKLEFDLKGQLVVAVTIDEEVGGKDGLLYLLNEGVKANAAIVGEPTSLHLVVSSKAPLWLRIRTLGKSAHAGNPEYGQNAIYKMCKILSAIEEYGSSYPSDPLLGKPTASVGKISGGQKANVVPDLCEAEIDFRFLPSQTPEMVIDEVKRIIKELANKDRTLAWETEIIRYRLPFSIDLNAALVKALKSSYKASTGMSLPTKGFLSPGDAEHLIASGIPTIIFGPGDESTAHVSNEWISLEEVHQALIIYAETILRFIENRSDDKENKS